MLWRKTLAVLRENPALCLPVAWATVLAYLWDQLRFVCVHVLPLYLLQTRSVLGGYGGLAEPGSSRYLTTRVIVGLTSNGCQFAHLACFYIALLMTAKMFWRHMTGASKGRLVNAQVLGLSLVMYVGLIAASLLLIVPVTILRHGAALPPFWLQVATTLVFALLALVFAAPSLRMVAREYEHTVGRKAVQTAQIYAVLSTIAFAALDLVVLHIHETGRNRYLVEAFRTVFLELITSVPLVLLFVAISLMAYEGEDQATTEAVSLRE